MSFTISIVAATGWVLSPRRRAAALVLLMAVMVLPVASVDGADDGPVIEAGEPRPAARGSGGAARPTADSVGDPLPERALLRLGTLRFRHPSNVFDVALSPDEQSLVTVGRGLFVWDTTTGTEKWRSGARKFLVELMSGYCIQAVAFSSDSRQFYSVGQWGEIIVWDMETGAREVVPITFPDPTAPEAKPTYDRTVGDRSIPHMKKSLSIDVTPDGQMFAVGSSHSVIVCERSGKLLYQIANETDDWPEIENLNRDRLTFNGPYSTGRFSPDGKLMAVASSDEPNLIRLHDSASGEELRRIELLARPVQFGFSPDGGRIVVTERDNAVRLYDAKTGLRLWSHVVDLNNPSENYTSAVAFAPDGTTVAAGATDYRIYLFDASEGTETGRLTGHFWYPWGLAITADSKRMYSAGWDGPIRRWDLEAQQQLPLPLGVHATEVAAASPDGRSLAYADDWRRIHIVSAPDGEETRTIPFVDMRYSQLAFSPDGHVLAAGGSTEQDVQVVLWDVFTGEQHHRFAWPKGRDPHSTVNSLSFTPDGRRLAAAVFRQSAAYLWELPTGKQIAKLPHGRVYGLSFSPDGATLATAGWDKIIRFWDAETGQFRRQIDVSGLAEGGDTRMYTVCFAPTGDMIATAHMDSSVRVWDAGDLTLQTRFQVKHGFVYGAMSFSPDGLWLATGGSTGQIELWDPRTGQKVWDTGRQQEHTYTVGFGRDSRTLLTAGDDGVAYLWDLRPPELSPDKSIDQLWDDFVGDDSRAAFQAMWALSETSHDTVALIDKKLQPAMISAEPDDDAATDGASSSEQAIIVRRTLTLLTGIGTADAVAMLKQWSRDDPQGLLGQSAMAALKDLFLSPQRTR